MSLILQQPERAMQKCPTKLAAIISGFNEVYALQLAMMAVASGEEVFINFDHNHDEQVQNDESWWCSTGSMNDARDLYENIWFHFPVIDRDENLAVEFWDTFLMPIVKLAQSARCERETPFDIQHFGMEPVAKIITDFNYGRNFDTSEIFACREDIATDILSCSDFIKATILAALHGHFRIRARVNYVHAAMGEHFEHPPEDGCVTIPFDYFRINALAVVSNYEKDDKRWAIFRPTYDDTNLMVARLSTVHTRTCRPRRFAKVCEKSKHVSWYDDNLQVFTIDKLHNLPGIIAEIESTTKK